MSARKSPAAAAQLAPHSWSLDSWPSTVWPHSGERARYVVRTLKLELIDAGALTRVGKMLVFMGAGYTRFLQQRGAKVAKFDVAANRERPAA